MGGSSGGIKWLLFSTQSLSLLKANMMLESQVLLLKLDEASQVLSDVVNRVLIRI